MATGEVWGLSFTLDRVKLDCLGAVLQLSLFGLTWVLRAGHDYLSRATGFLVWHGHPHSFEALLSMQHILLTLRLNINMFFLKKGSKLSSSAGYGSRSFQTYTERMSMVWWFGMEGLRRCLRTLLCGSACLLRVASQAKLPSENEQLGMSEIYSGRGGRMPQPPGKVRNAV